MMAYHRVLKLVFKAAWKEKWSPCAWDTNPLQSARECRDQTWWYLVQNSCSRTDMKQQHLQHRCKGAQRTAWDDVLALVFGPAWRSFRDQHSSLTEWMKHCTMFIDKVCGEWGLPLLCKPGSKVRGVPIHCRIPAAIDIHPHLEPHDLDKQWQSDLGRLWIQVDCKALADLCAGRSFLSAPQYRPLFIRICRCLQFLHNFGQRPVHDRQDLIIWSPREFNTVADHAVNAALDSQSTWTRCDNDLLADALIDGRSLRLCLDGGRRSESQAAVGLALFAVERDGSGMAKYKLLVRRAMVLESIASAFLAEAVALEWGLQYLVELFKGKVTATSKSLQGGRP